MLRVFFSWFWGFWISVDIELESFKTYFAIMLSDAKMKENIIINFRSSINTLETELYQHTDLLKAKKKKNSAAGKTLKSPVASVILK